MSVAKKRGVHQNILTSTFLPKISFDIDGGLDYLGNLKFSPNDIAAVDLYLFAAVGEGLVKRLLLFQFEGYLPDNNYRYDYPIADNIRLGENDYLHDAGVLHIDRAVQKRPDGDIAHWSSWLTNQGYAPLLETIYRRYVRLLDPHHRNEMLILYMENLALHAWKADDLLPHGAHHGEWPRIAQDLAHRALKSFTIVTG